MNLQEMRKKFAEYLKTIEAFTGNEKPTEDQVAEYKTALTEAKKLKGQIEELEAQQADVADLRKFASVPAEPMPKVEASTNEQTKTKGIHGADVFQRDVDGTLKMIYTDDPLFGSEKLKKLASDDYRKAFRSYIRSKGDMDGVDREERKALSVGIDEEGGFLVPPQMLNRIVGQKPGRARAIDLVTIQTTSSSGVRMLREEDTDEDVYGTVLRPQKSAEGRDATLDDQDKLKPFSIEVHEELTGVNITRTFMEDDPSAVESYLARKFRQADRMKTESKILAGTGSGEAFGIITRLGDVYGPDTRNVGHPVDLDELIEAYYELPEQYAENAKILMRRTTYGVLSTLQDGAGAYAFGQMNVYDGQAVRPVENFKGTEIVFSDLMPASGSANNIALYGDFAETYMMVVRMGLSLRFRDLPDEGYVKAVFRKRYGGDVMFGRAMKCWVQSAA